MCSFGSHQAGELKKGASHGLVPISLECKCDKLIRQLINNKSSIIMFVIIIVIYRFFFFL